MIRNKRTLFIITIVLLVLIPSICNATNTIMNTIDDQLSKQYEENNEEESDLDTIAPTVEKMEINCSDLSNYYDESLDTYKFPIGTKLTIEVTFNEEIKGDTAPILVISCGNGNDITLTNGEIASPIVSYSYTIKEDDIGQIAANSLSGGNITDVTGNNAVLTCTKLVTNNSTAYANGSSVIDDQNSDSKNTAIPTDAQLYNGHYYYIYEEKKTWKDAKKYCETLGGHLATITTKEEQEFIEKYLSNEKYKNKRFWLGATDEKTEGKWEWVTGEVFDYSNWGKGEPDNLTGKQHYLIIENKNVIGDKYNIEKNQWDDIQSTYTEYFICEWDNNKKPQESEINDDKKEDNQNIVKNLSDINIIEDNSLKNDSKLPQTGSVLLLEAISLIVVVIILKVKYDKYKDIK